MGVRYVSWLSLQREVTSLCVGGIVRVRVLLADCACDLDRPEEGQDLYYLVRSLPSPSSFLGIYCPNAVNFPGANE